MPSALRDKYAVVVCLWECNWEDLATMLDYLPDIRRQIYTTSTVEGYNEQLGKVLKSKGASPSSWHVSDIADSNPIHSIRSYCIALI